MAAALSVAAAQTAATTSWSARGRRGKTAGLAAGAELRVHVFQRVAQRIAGDFGSTDSGLVVGASGASSFKRSAGGVGFLFGLGRRRRVRSIGRGDGADGSSRTSGFGCTVGLRRNRRRFQEPESARFVSARAGQL